MELRYKKKLKEVYTKINRLFKYAITYTLEILNKQNEEDKKAMK